MNTAHFIYFPFNCFIENKTDFYSIHNKITKSVKVKIDDVFLLCVLRKITKINIK